MGNIPMDYSVLPKGEETEKLKSIILQEGIQDYQLHIGPGSTTGENYMGAIFQIKIKGVDNNQKPKELDLILKCSGRDEQYRDSTPDGINTVQFHREIQIYTVVLPKFFEMQNNAAIQNGFFPFAKVYGWSDKVLDEFIFMENKKAQGFKIANRLKPLNIHHCKLVLKQLGYLHAFALTLKELDPKLHKHMSEAYEDVSITQFFKNKLKNTFINQIKEKNKRAIETFDPISEKHLQNRILKFLNTSTDQLKDLVSLDNKDEYFVLIHGDCWINNLLFKYKDISNEENPTEVCFIDWQTSKWASPVFDLSYFIYNCMDPEIYQKHFDYFIKYYYESACSMIKQLGVEPEKVYPFSALERHIEKYFRFGVILNVIALPMTLSDSEEIPKEGEILTVEDEKNWFSNSNNYDDYVKRIRGVLIHAASKNFF